MRPRSPRRPPLLPARDDATECPLRRPASPHSSTGGAAKTEGGSQALEDEIFELKARLQREALLAGAHRPVGPAALEAIRRELMPLRYAAITMRRHEVPELAALQTVVRLSGRPQQRLFADADSYELREAEARQEALVESLHATIAAGEALQNEVGAHAAWQQSTYSAQLTTLGCVLSVLGLCSVSFDALAFLQGEGAFAAAVRSLFA